jgi:membrane carboxypeptidase/penicillin-binding protein
MTTQEPQNDRPKTLTLLGWRQWPRWRKLAALILLGLCLGLGGMTGLVMGYMEDLPVVPGPDNLTPSLATKIYDINGQLITQLAIENRTLISLEQMPPALPNAIIALEDRRFWSHWGVDPWGILRAAAVNLKAGRTIEGGSTITQQLAKNLFLTRERKFSRKVKEALLSLQIERRFTKKEILAMYFNQVYFGNGAYGVEAAARTYFGKHAAELSLSECATLAGIPRSPNANNPIDDPKQAQFRRDTALASMLEMGFITKEQHDAALAEPITVFQADPVVAAYFVEQVREQLETSYGANAVYKGGLSVYTTLDLRLQDIAQRAAETGARQADALAAPFLEHEFGLAEKPVLQLAFLPWTRATATSWPWWAGATSASSSSTAPPRRCASPARPSSPSSTPPPLRTASPLPTPSTTFRWSTRTRWATNGSRRTSTRNSRAK